MGETSERCGFCTNGIYYHKPRGPAAERLTPAGSKCPYCHGTGMAQETRNG